MSLTDRLNRFSERLDASNKALIAEYAQKAREAELARVANMAELIEVAEAARKSNGGTLPDEIVDAQLRQINDLTNNTRY